MKTIHLNGNYLEMYDSIDELPIVRFMQYNRYVMIDSGIGGDLEAVTQRISFISQFISKDEKDKALVELNNLHQAMAFVVENSSPQMNAFICLVAKVNGKAIESISDDEIVRQIQELSRKGLTFGKLRGFLEYVKKKFAQEFDLFFPKMGNDTRAKELYSKIRTRTLAVLDGLLGKDTRDIVANLDEQLLYFHNPQVYSGAGGAEVAYINGFEDMCITLNQHIPRNPKSLTVLEFYRAIEKLKEQFKAQAKANGRKG